MTTQSKAIQNPHFWQQHVDQWKGSGLSQADYCKKHELKPHNFSYHKCKQENDSAPTSNASFLQIPVPQLVAAPEPLTVHLSRDVYISGITDNNITLVKRLVGELS